MGAHTGLYIVVREWLDDYIKHKTTDGIIRTSKSSLAQLLIEEKPLLFNDKEHARSVIRHVTGANGNKSGINTHGHAFQRYTDMPDGDVEPFLPYVIPHGITGVLSDIHIPYQCNQSLDWVHNILVQRDIDNLVLLGDIVDCYQASDFDKDPSKASLAQEFDMLCTWFYQIKRIYNGVKIIYKIGNHEERWERVLKRKAPMLWGIEIFRFEKLIPYLYYQKFGEELNIDIVSDKRILHAGKLNLVHGHEFGRGMFNPVSPARRLLLQSYACALQGDSHIVSENTKKDINGKLIGTWSIGCLCKLNPPYKPINDWMNGFAIVEHDQDGFFEVENKKFIDKKKY